MKKQPLPYLLYGSLWNLLDLVFPPACGGCGGSGSRWRDSCRGKTPVLSRSICCEVCGAAQDVPDVCENCRADPPRFRALRAWTVFDGPARRALHTLKYKRDMSMGDALAAQMIPFVEGLDWRVDMLAPIPLGRRRLKERGYN